MTRRTTAALIAEMDAKLIALARETGDQIQSLRDAPSGLRRVAPPTSDTSPGQAGDIAIDNEYVYFYLGNGTTHKWGQSLLITQF